MYVPMYFVILPFLQKCQDFLTRGGGDIFERHLRTNNLIHLVKSKMIYSEPNLPNPPVKRHGREKTANYNMEGSWL